jgi:hypothetical protein
MEGQAMQQILSNSRVRLARELVDLQLHQGEMGVVRSSWHYPTVAYEVEFRPAGKPLRVLLLDHEIIPAPTKSEGTI